MKVFVKLSTIFFACLAFSLNDVYAASNFNNPIVFGNNRITLITPTLFRLEYALDGKFLDSTTMFAYTRDTLLSDFKVTELGDNKFLIETKALRMVYENDGFPFGIHNFTVFLKLNGEEKKLLLEIFIRIIWGERYLHLTE